MSIPSIQSEGDLEVVVLHEAHGLLASIINPQLYEIEKDNFDQTARFHRRPCLDLFVILVIELFAEGGRSAYIDSKYQNWSLLKGLAWLSEKYPEESRAAGLDAAVKRLTGWLAREDPFEFWCPDVWLQITFPLSYERLISFGANSTKHHLLRLNELLAKLDKICTCAGHSFTPQQLVSVLGDMTTEADSRLIYVSTCILELYGNLLLAINRLICARFRQHPTNQVNDMDHPKGLTSDIFRNLYGSVLVFKRYEEDRITDYTPVTTRWDRLGEVFKTAGTS
jgi:hypothetical protein